ncbi:tRNA epoxyqueuosine(34) reductase QueG [Synechococcus sp. M16CYN]|uniref:tRNA epoxyqueuosine(34) reductase QueG n=1 Tax=Synechococcus sp. M16CYN TaxID=3103139 RepID=UPI003253AB05
MAWRDSNERVQLSQALKQRALEEGFNPVGIALLPGSPRLQLRTQALQRWLDHGYQASMAWMTAPRRHDASLLLDGARSLLAVGLNYYVSTQRHPRALKVARYGWGRDYHRVVSKRLRRVGRWLSTQQPGCQWRVCVDSSPLLDKAWAEEAGLGWIGKHSNVIHPRRGSWMVIGHLLTTEPLQADAPARSLCGRCTACIDACPTGAIREPFVVDAKRCLAFHTIENRDPELPDEIRTALGPWIAGCDICQDVCPWNHGNLPCSNDSDMQPRPWLLNASNQNIQRWDDATWNQKLRGSTLRRIKPWMWRRNAATAQLDQTPTL